MIFGPEIFPCFVSAVNPTEEDVACFHFLISAELWKVRLGEGAETSTRGRVRSPD